MNDTQLFLAIGMPTLAVLTGILANHRQVSAINARLADMNTRIGEPNGRVADFRQEMNVRFDDLKETWRAELRRVKEVLDARLKHLEER